MFGRNKGVSGFASNALETVSPYTDRLAHDEKLRERLVAALTAGMAARQRAQRDDQVARRAACRHEQRLDRPPLAPQAVDH